jgi:REP element-mobilizing transposase RayT
LHYYFIENIRITDKGRMARPLRIHYSGAWYHIYDTSLGKRLLFPNDDYRHYFMELLEEVTQVYSVEIHAYCLMDQEFHLLVHTPLGNISDAMRHLLSKYTIYYNHQKRHEGPLFKRRYKSVLIENDEHTLQVSRYIHRLPKRRKETRSLSFYQWSSYPCYIGIHKAESFLKKNEVLHFLASRNSMAQYRIYVETGDDEEIHSFYDRKRVSPILGSNQFKTRILKSKKVDDTEVPDIKLVHSKPEIDEIVKRVADAMNVSVDKILASQRGRGKRNVARSFAVSLCRNVGGHPLKAIAKHFGVSHYSAVSVCICRLKQTLADEPLLNKKYETILKSLPKTITDQLC